MRPKKLIAFVNLTKETFLHFYLKVCLQMHINIQIKIAHLNQLLSGSKMQHY